MARGGGGPCRCDLQGGCGGGSNQGPEIVVAGDEVGLTVDLPGWVKEAASVEGRTALTGWAATGAMHSDPTFACTRPVLTSTTAAPSSLDATPTRPSAAVRVAFFPAEATPFLLSS